PTQWVDWNTGVSYFVAVQTPQYRIQSLENLLHTPISPLSNAVNVNTATSLAGASNGGNSFVGASPSQTSLAYGNPGAASAGPQLLANLAGVTRGVGPEIVNHY